MLLRNLNDSHNNSNTCPSSKLGIMQTDKDYCLVVEDEDATTLEDSPNSSRAYEGDISVSESYGSVALSEALGNEPVSLTGSKPIDLTGTNISGFTVLPSTAKQGMSSVRQQVELICARGRIVQLESELDSVKRGTKRARIADGTSHVTMGGEEGKRLHEVKVQFHNLLNYMIVIVQNPPLI